MADSFINLRIGAVAIVELDDHPSSGYLWEAVSVPECCELLPREARLPSSGAGLGGPVAFGGSSPTAFLLRAIAQGSGEAVFRLARPWNQAQAAEEFRVALQVEP